MEAKNSPNPAQNANPTSWRYPTQCYVVGAFLILYLLGSSILILAIHVGYPVSLSSFPQLRLHIMSASFGALGASVAFMRKFYRFLISEEIALEAGNATKLFHWSFGWVYYYLTRPLVGGIIGALSYTLSYVGLQTLEKKPSLDLAPEGKYLLYAIAFIAGFSVSTVLDRLNAISKQLFKSTPE